LWKSKLFRCPWPIEKLNGVAPDADVFVMGSMLTAIDVANALVEKGHRGAITFISRSGHLPKVQRKQNLNERGYILASLAKDVESTPEGNNMFQVMAKVLEELDNVGIKEFSHPLAEVDPTETLRADIAEAGMSYKNIRISI
jgi:uncharacterized NAD(P)/FAD-binding protein YdhS